MTSHKVYGSNFVSKVPRKNYSDVLDNFETSFEDSAPVSSTSELDSLLGPAQAYDSFRYGKYRGTTFKEVIESDPQYIRWLLTCEGLIKPVREEARMVLALLKQK
jgi:hypothetical protein